MTKMLAPPSRGMRSPAGRGSWVRSIRARWSTDGKAQWPKPTLRQVRPQAARGAQQRDAAVAVVQVGWGDDRDHQAAIRVGQPVALAPDHAPGRIVAACPCHADPDRPSGLSIQNGAGRAGVAPDALAIGHRQGVGQPLAQPCLRRAQEPAVQGAPWWELVRQVAPRATGAQHAEDTVQRRAQRPMSQAAHPGGAVSSGARTAHSASLRQVAEGRLSRAKSALAGGVHIRSLG